MNIRPHVAIVTVIPSPYQVELFDRLAARADLQPTVIYIARNDQSRSWSLPPLQHDHVFIADSPGCLSTARNWVKQADLLISSWYSQSSAFELLQERRALRKPWCYWGERPGFAQLGLLGVMYRRWKLRGAYLDQAPIWGIGSWAVEGYRKEFGHNRLYLNVPYFSDLNRFQCRRPERQGQVPRTFLFSGSLIPRKGIDVLANAFLRLWRDCKHVLLSVLGEGHLAARLQRRLRDCRCAVQFHGFQAWGDLPRFYTDADFLCVPSRYDGWGLVVPEGLAAGLPVIASERVGSARDLVTPGDNGWIVPANDEHALYLAMRRAASLPSEQLHGLSLRASRSVLEHSLEAGATLFAQSVEKTLDAWYRLSADRTARIAGQQDR
jgi:glycosyltransferase involved in cell wall biosynthesis